MITITYEDKNFNQVSVSGDTSVEAIIPSHLQERILFAFDYTKGSEESAYFAVQVRGLDGNFRTLWIFDDSGALGKQELTLTADASAIINYNIMPFERDFKVVAYFNNAGDTPGTLNIFTKVYKQPYQIASYENNSY